MRALPNARVTLGFWTLPFCAESGAEGCLDADLVCTPVRCCCACAAPAVGVALPALPLEVRVVYLGVLKFSLSVAVLVGVDLGLAFFGSCCSPGMLLLAEAGLNADRCHLFRVLSFDSINALSQLRALAANCADNNRTAVAIHSNAPGDWDTPACTASAI